MSDRSNVGGRVLAARKTVLGNEDALENIIGTGLHDGAQCFVVEAQANYRFLKQSVLPPDGELIVAPVGNQGRWVRESGLVGLALLEEGAAHLKDDGDRTAAFMSYTHDKRAQFEWDKDGPGRSAVVYVGTIPRLALLFASAELLFDRGHAQLFIQLDSPERVVATTSLQHAGHTVCGSAVQLVPGDKLSLHMRAHAATSGRGSLRVVLV